ncbi:hypothetical protein ACFLVP_03630 [Chloroflexota bacterium]
MSKLTEKLNKLTQDDSKPFGFTASVSKSILPRMLTIARIKFDIEANTIPEIDTDAVLLSVDVTSKAIDFIKKINKEKLPAIWGIEAASISRKEADQLIKIGCDYIVLKLTSPSPVLASDEKLAKIIKINPSINDTMIRAINLLPVDTVFIEDDSEAPDIMIERLMIYSSIAAMVEQPLLLSVSLKLAKDTFEAIRDIGVTGLILDWSSPASNKKIAEIKDVIQSLPEKKRNSRKRGHASLPSIPGASYDEDNDFEK